MGKFYWGVLVVVCLMSFGLATAQVEINQEYLNSQSLESLQEKIEFYKYQNNDTALFFAQELLNRSQGIIKVNERLRNIGFVARVYIHLGYYDLALKLYQDILPEIEVLNDSELIAESYHYMGVLYEYMDHFTKSISFYKRSLSLKSKDDLLGTLHSLHGLGDTYRRMSMYDSSHYALKKAFGLSRQLDNLELKGQVALAYVETLVKLDSISMAKDVFTYVVDTIAYGRESELGMAYVMGIEGMLLAKQGDYKKSILKLESAIEKTKKMNYGYGVLTGYRWLLPILEEAKEYELAFKHYKIFNEYEMSTFKSGQDKIITQLEILHQTQQKDQAILFQADELAKRRIAIFILTGLVLLSIVLTIIVYRYSIFHKKMTASLSEKNLKIETLMRELHHRVKNNLQVISSLLGLQSMKMEKGDARRAIEEGKSRVRAMSMIHQKLYRKEDLMGVNFNEYVLELVNELKNTYRPDDEIVIDIKVPSISMDVDTTLPLGLMINEMVSNSFKYAFIDIEKPILKIELLEETNRIKLIVSDNGSGLSKDFDFDAATSFGIKLIRMLTRQLNADLSIDSSSGLQYELLFNYKR